MDWAQELRETVLGGFAIALEPPPPMIWHYTSAAGLKGIVETGTIWASHYLFLNDRMEVRMAREQCEAAAANVCHMHEYLTPKRFSSAIDFVLERGIFVASFSADGDLLSQWQLYADEGRGFAMGFSSELLSGAVGQIHPVYYDATDERCALEERLRSLLEVFDGTVPTNDRERAAPLMLELMAEHAIRYMTIKHKAFAAEQESRCYLVGHSVQDEPSTYERRGLLTPYVSVRLWEKGQQPAVQAVRLGPLQDKDCGRVAVRSLWKSAGLHVSPLEITASQIPYQQLVPRR